MERVGLATPAQGVEIDHGFYVADLFESPVYEIQGTGHPLLPGPESDKKDGTAEQALVLRHHPGQLNEDGDAGRIRIGAGKNLDDRLSVNHQRVCPKMVVTGTYHDILLAELRIGAFHDADDIL